MQKMKVKNCLGIEEQETKSKKFNLVEAFVVYLLVLGIFWLLVYPFSIHPEGPQLDWIETLGYILLGLLALWALIFSPIIHKDTFRGVGLGHPKQFIKYMSDIRNERDYKRLLPLFIVFIMLYLGYLVFLPDIKDAFGTSTTITLILSLPLVAILTLIVSLFMIRWDNFHQTWKVILIGLTIVIPYLTAFGVFYCIIGTLNWDIFTGIAFWGTDGLYADWFAYIWWGFVQHWLFLGYFNTRLRKGLPEHKILGVKGKWWTGIINMFFFGIIHIPAWELAIFAFTGGIFFSYYFQKDKYRNLFAFGLIHGVGGALLGRLVPWELSVGPWA